MKYQHIHRPGFLLGFLDFFTAGLLFMVMMPLGLQAEIDSVLGHRTMPYWKAYLIGIPTLFIYPIIWMGRIADELKEKADDMGIEGPHTSFRHMFLWNTLGLPLCGFAVATHRFFGTLGKIEEELNRMEKPVNGDKGNKT